MGWVWKFVTNLIGLRLESLFWRQQLKITITNTNKNTNINTITNTNINTILPLTPIYYNLGTSQELRVMNLLFKAV